MKRGVNPVSHVDTQSANLKIIPKSITDRVDRIRKMLDNPLCCGVIITNKRYYGNTLVKQLLETEDINYEES